MTDEKNAFGQLKRKVKRKAKLKALRKAKPRALRKAKPKALRKGKRKLIEKSRTGIDAEGKQPRAAKNSLNHPPA